MSTFDIDIGAHLLEQSSGNENLAAAITLGLGVRQIQPYLTAGTVIGENEIGDEERRRFFQPKPCGHKEIGEKRIANAVAISGAGACAAVRQKRLEADIPKAPIVLERDETDVRSTRGRFIGIVPHCHLGPPPGVPRPPDGAMREGCFSNQSFLHTPAI